MKKFEQVVTVNKTLLSAFLILIICIFISLRKKDLKVFLQNITKNLKNSLPQTMKALLINGCSVQEVMLFPAAWPFL